MYIYDTDDLEHAAKQLLSGGAQDIGKELINIINSAIRLSNRNTPIDLQIKYTNNEYGAAARELGLIKCAYVGDAGIDLPTILSQEDRQHGLTIHPGDRIVLHTGMAMAFDEGYWARIVHRSSTEKKHRLRVIEGVIDQYRAEILVQVHNGNTWPITIEHGQRIAQLIICKTCTPIPRIVEELPPSQRGQNGFGSSGV